MPSLPTRSVRPAPTRCSDVADDSGRPGAWAVVKHDTPQIFLAENAQVISRLLALKVVAGADPSIFEPGSLETVQEHLLHERWADAVLMWMDAADTFIDVYEEFVPVWTEAELDSEVASMAIRTSRLFEGET